MGNPDRPPPQHVIDKLCEVAGKPSAHGYSQSKGIPGLRRAQANYYARRFGVDLDPEREVVVTMGSKEGLASLATAITAPGDVILAPNPSYPIHTFGFIIAGATIRAVPTTPVISSATGCPSAVNALAARLTATALRRLPSVLSFSQMP